VIYEHANYRSYLRSVLAERVSKNPAYSLRSMARQLDMAPSSLSEVLKGKKNLSQQNAAKVATRLGLQIEESDYFCLLAQYETTKDLETKSRIQRRLHSFKPARVVHDLSVDQFKMISEWYHLPILHLITLGKRNLTPKEIGSRLGITAIEAEAALERLERLELVHKDESGLYQKTPGRLMVSSQVPSGALRNYHRQLLEKSIDALQTQTPEERITGSETFAFDRSRIEKARERVYRFLNEMAEEFGGGERASKTDVYHLSLQFFNLTKEGKTK
jgi:uncharacterized protein (TIGR02147 family)